MTDPTFPMTRRMLAEMIGEVAELEGRFRLRSGLTATTYFDKYLFEADPLLLRSIAEHLRILVPPGTEVLAGLELGGVPVATALSLATDLPAAFVRKEAKAYGTEKLAEGAAVEGRRVLVVEDVVTTGGQIVASVADLRERGALIDTALCVVDREQGGVEALAAVDVELVALLTRAEIESATADDTVGANDT